MGLPELYIKWVDIYVPIIEKFAEKNPFKVLNPFLFIARNNLIKSKVRT